MAFIPGQTGTPARAVDGLEGPTSGSPVTFPAGFKGSQIPESVPDANFTMTISSPSTIVLNPSANRVVTLPTTGVPANYSVTVINRSASFTVEIQPSGGGTITTVGLGQVTVISTQVAPTTTAHWFISNDGAILQGGNSLGAPMVIGTNDAQSLSLETNGVARMTFDTSGNATIPATSNQVTLGTTNTVTISSPAPAASRTYTIPDAGGAANFVMSAGTNTIGGTLTLPATVNYTSAGSIVKSGVGALTLTAAGTSTMTFPSITGTVATLAGTETLTNKTITASGLITASAGITVPTASNQFTLSSGVNQLIINSGTSVAARTYTIPDAGTTSAFVMTSGNQTIAGTKTFSSTISGSINGNAATVTNYVSGTWTPVFTAGSNTGTVPSVAAGAAIYSRLGNVVFFSISGFGGRWTTAATRTNFTFTLPIATASTTDYAGLINVNQDSTATHNLGRISIDNTGAKVDFTPDFGGTNNHFVYIMGSYFIS